MVNYRDLGSCFLEFNLFNQTLTNLLQIIEKLVLYKKKSKIMYLNIHVVNEAFKNKRLKEILNSADILYCDGEGVRIGAEIFGKHIPHRMTGADWIYDLCNMCEKKGLSLFIVGARPGVTETGIHVLKTRFPKLKIAGYHHGYFNKYGTENDAVINTINKSKVDILLVGFGTPLQETWMDENFKSLNVPVIWAMGAVMDYVSGTVRRAPAWIHKNGMEWLFRLYLEPGRMWKRYFIGNAVFFYRILKERFNNNHN
jgi:N-acetylglucosaminyldiphosphoundecaprenol N-acetyl-beta-D-mannosaminyltransferase